MLKRVKVPPYTYTEPAIVVSDLLYFYIAVKGENVSDAYPGLSKFYQRTPQGYNAINTLLDNRRRKWKV